MKHFNINNDDTQDLPPNQLFYNWEDFAANKEHLSQHVTGTPKTIILQAITQPHTKM